MKRREHFIVIAIALDEYLDGYFAVMDKITCLLHFLHFK